MHRAGEDAAEHDPDQGRRAVEGAQDGAEDRAQTGDVQELHHVDGLGVHLDVVDPVFHAAGRGGPAVIGAEICLDEFSVNEIAGDQRGYGEKEVKHISLLEKCCFPPVSSPGNDLGTGHGSRHGIGRKYLRLVYNEGRESGQGMLIQMSFFRGELPGRVVEPVGGKLFVKSAEAGFARSVQM